MTVHFTSDWHFGHVNILKYCERHRYLDMPADGDVTAMNEALVQCWNSQVAYGDVVYVLGDMCMGKVAETLSYVTRLNGSLKLIPGNHDRMHPIMHKSDEKTAEWVAAYEDAGFDVWDIGPHEFVIDGIKCAVSHFPYEGDHTEEERYGSYRPDDNGLPLVHGHVHDLYQTNGRQFNVGVDAWAGKMVSPEQIGSYFSAKGFTS